MSTYSKKNLVFLCQGASPSASSFFILCVKATHNHNYIKHYISKLIT